jgi:hypothetical protein
MPAASRSTNPRTHGIDDALHVRGVLGCHVRGKAGESHATLAKGDERVSSGLDLVLGEAPHVLSFSMTDEGAFRLSVRCPLNRSVR